MAGDASKVTASGAGLQRSGVMAKNKTSFDVHTKSRLLCVCACVRMGVNGINAAAQLCAGFLDRVSLN